MTLAKREQDVKLPPVFVLIPQPGWTKDTGDIAFRIIDPPAGSQDGSDPSARVGEGGPGPKSWRSLSSRRFDSVRTAKVTEDTPAAG